MTSEEFTSHLVKGGSYRRQPWHCKVCDAKGEVLFHKGDTPAKRQWRLEQSHRAHSNKGVCPAPIIVRTV